VRRAYRAGFGGAGRPLVMGLSMSQRHAVTKTIATRYKRADKAEKGQDPRRAVRHDGVAPQPCP